MPIDYPQVEIKRHMDRKGGSQYRLNGKVARLADIHLLLAQAGVGQKSYAVIGQGMVDHILVSTPEERKSFFDDATGVKQFQLKRHEAMLKLKRTYENLEEVELVLNEIGPRLRSLKRQVSRLEKREVIENELRDLQLGYYGTLWWTLHDQLKEVRINFDKLDVDCRTLEVKTKSLEKKAAEIEEADQEKETTDQDLVALQNQYRELQRERSRLRDQEYEVQKEIELKKVQAEAKWTPLPLPDIIKELETLTEEHKSLVDKLKNSADVSGLADKLHERSEKLLKRLRKPAPDKIKPDPGLAMDLKDTQKKRTELPLQKAQEEISIQVQLKNSLLNQVQRFLL